MPDNKSISQLTTAEQTTSSDLFETSIPNGSLGYLSRKVSLDSIADYIGNDHLFSSDLQTTDKTLTGAINEAAQSGGGGASIEEMTQAEYNALTPEQKADGTLRAISDASTSIGDIDDVNITSAADGDVLSYDSTSSKWVNKELEADAVAYDNASSILSATDVQAAIDEVSKRSFKQTLLIDTTITNAQSVTIPGFSNYDFVQVIIQGDNYNGISVFVPTVLSSILNPFALYTINKGETFTGHAIHANGIIHHGIVEFHYLEISGWSECIIKAYGIKYE